MRKASRLEGLRPMRSRSTEAADRSIALVYEKGGCGKSTTVLNAAAGMAACGFSRVLMVDTHPQANSS
jgi:chromosome partitioning protein